MFDVIVQSIIHRMHLERVYVDYGFDLDDNATQTVAVEDWKQNEEIRFLVVFVSKINGNSGRDSYAMVIAQLFDTTIYVYDPCENSVDYWSDTVSQVLKR